MKTATIEVGSVGVAAGRSSLLRARVERSPTRVRPRRVPVVLAGASGRVGRALTAQLCRQRSELLRRGLDVRLVGVFNRSRQRWSEDGFEPWSIDDPLVDGEPHDGSTLPHRLQTAPPQTVFVDCTASPLLARYYPRLLARGIAVVTPNKQAGSGPRASFRRLRAALDRGNAPFLDSATVGAGLPILASVRALCGRGEGLRRFGGVLSGTLAFVLARVAEGRSFAAAVAEAVALGYTEPDPRDDLRGEDVARKLLIVLRAAGLDIAKRRLSVQSLVPPGAASVASVPDFLASLERDDGGIGERARRAAARGCRLIYAAWYEDGDATAGLREEAMDSALARVRPGENVALVWSDGYREVPLTIAGMGAGPEITALAVLGDILTAAAHFDGT